MRYYTQLRNKKFMLMKNTTIVALTIIFSFLWTSCNSQINLGKALEDVKKGVSDVVSGDSPLTNAEIVSGLKQALEQGTGKSVNVASAVNGYYKNPALFIPFPPEAEDMEKTLRNVGFGKQVDKFVETLNRAAEEAAKEAKPIFVNSIKQMTVNDAMNILMGADDAATQFFKRTTTNPLTTKFTPVVKRAIETVQVAKYWEPLAKRYNQVPFVKKVNPDLNAYVTQKGIDGLFVLVAKEEKNIRDNPGARATDILKKVFAKQDGK